MKNGILISCILLLNFTACNKAPDCETTTPITVATANETAYLQNFLTSNNITAIQKNGMFYTLTQGSGTSPNACGQLTVKYKGQIVNATSLGGTFDETVGGATAALGLDQVIDGWQIILPLVKAGSTVALYIPPSLGYKDRNVPARQGYSGIPPNSYLKFDIELVGVKN